MCSAEVAGPGEVWREAGPGVLVRRHLLLDVTVTLVLGRDRALLVDTNAHPGLGADLLAAVRSVTPLPLDVAYTHAHFDHCLGTPALVPDPAVPDPAGIAVWAHPGCHAVLAGADGAWRREGVDWMRAQGRPADAERIAAAPVVLPTRLVPRRTRLDLGGREVVLAYPGPGHTGHDLVVHVPDAGVSVLGDLVEQGAPPAFDDSFPWHWPATLDALLPGLGPVVVPGHGDLVDPGFVAAQRDDLAQVPASAARLRERTPPGRDPDPVLVDELAAELRIGVDAGRTALLRALITAGAPPA